MEGKKKRSREESGKYLIHVCRGEACMVKDAEKIAAALRRELEIKENEDTSPDGLFTLEEVSCVDCCERAPVIMIEGHAFGRTDPQKAVRAVKRFLDRITG